MKTPNTDANDKPANDGMRRAQRMRSTAQLPPRPRARVAVDRKVPTADRLWRSRVWILVGSVVLLSLAWGGAAALPRPTVSPSLPPQVTIPSTVPTQSATPTPGTSSTPGADTTPTPTGTPTPGATGSATPQPAADGVPIRSVATPRGQTT